MTSSPSVHEPSAAALRWWILAMLFACRAALGFQFQTLGSVSESLVAGLGFSYAQVGTLIGLFMLPGLVLALPAGYLGRLVADRTLVSLAYFCMAGGAALAALAQGFGLLALGRIACGAGFVFSTIYLTKMTADWFSGRELATAMGILVMSWPFGIAIGQLGQVWLDLHYGWQSVFVAAALYSACAAAALWLLYRPPAALPEALAQQVGLQRHEWWLTLLAALCWGLYNAGYIVYLSFAPRALVAGGVGAAQAAAVISLASWAMIVSGAVGGRVADRSGYGTPMFFLCCLVGLASLLLLQQHIAWAVPLSVLFGLAGGAPAGVIMALTGEAMAPRRRAFGMGVFFSIYFLLLSAAPPFAGLLHDASGDPWVPLRLAMLLFFGAALAFGAFKLLRRGLVATALRTNGARPAP